MGATKQSIPKRTLVRRPWACSRKHAACSRIFFPSGEIEQVAADTGLIERKRKLTGQLVATTLAFWAGDTIGYSDLAADLAVNADVKVTKQALHTKLGKAEPFFQTLVTRALNSSASFLPRPVAALPGIGDIFISDASTLALRSKLAAVLKGTGGSGPAASLKLHGLINMSRQQFARIALTDGKTSDHSEKKAHSLILKESDLIIRDMGYFDIADLDGLQNSGRFFLTRIPLSIKAFADLAGDVIDVWSDIASSHRFVLDRQLKVGDEGFSTRLIALRLPKAKAQERLAAARKERGRPLTKLEKTQARWNLFMTNLSVEQASVETLKALYAWRWQVELVWKALKSVLDIGSVKTATCEAVVLAYVWARLLYAVVMMIVRGLVQQTARQEIGVLCWYRRLAPQLATMRGLLRRESWCALSRLVIELATEHCGGGKRQRNTTLERIRESANLGRFSTGASND
jgi:hypothetical protein